MKKKIKNTHKLITDLDAQCHWNELDKYNAEIDVWRGAADWESGVRAEGELAKARSMAIRLLKDGIDIKTITYWTDLSIEEIEALKKN